MPDQIVAPTTLTSTMFQDGQAAGSISPQDMRNLIVSAFGVYNTQQSVTNYTAQLTDQGTCVEMTSASACSFTVPNNSSVAFPIGAAIQVCQYGLGQVQIVAFIGVTIRTASSFTTRAHYSTVMLRQRAADEWVLSGDLT